MATANRLEAPRPNPVAAGRTPQDDMPAWCGMLEQAEAYLLTLESLTASACAVLATAAPKGRADRRQFERARLTLSPLPEVAAALARPLDAPGGPIVLDVLAVSQVRNAIADFMADLEDAITALQAIDTHGEAEGAGAMALHADVVLNVAIEQLGRADAHLRKAIPAMANDEPCRGQA